MASPRPIDALLDAVRRRGVGDDALDRLDAAMATSADLETDADAVVRHFVDEARDAGHSWTAIGQRLGVSKQAARKRFVEADSVEGTAPHPPRSTPRLVRCLEAAHREAASAGAAEVGTEHVLLGLFVEGVAASTLTKLGLSNEQARAAVQRRFGASRPVAGAIPVEGAEAEACSARAAVIAGQAGVDYVGTEHVLYALIMDPGCRGRLVLQDLGADFGAIKRDLECYVSPALARRRRRRAGKWHEGGSCSFCGKQRTDGVALVAGPGVAICNDCVRVANEILARR